MNLINQTKSKFNIAKTGMVNAGNSAVALKLIKAQDNVSGPQNTPDLQARSAQRTHEIFTTH